MKKVLVVIDMQTKFIAECRAERIIPAVARKIERRREEGYEILFTLDKSGGEMTEEIARQRGNPKIYSKRSYGCAELIRDLFSGKPDVVEFAGVCTDVCVITNVLATMAFLPFAEIVVDESCCASHPEKHLAAIEVMKSCNVTVLSGCE